MNRIPRLLGVCLGLFLSMSALLSAQGLLDRITVFSPPDPVLESVEIHSVYAGPQGTLWGTEKGVHYEKPDGTRTWFNESNAPFKLDTFSGVTIYANDIWIAVRNPGSGQGLFRYNGSKWQNYNPGTHRMLSSLITCLHADSKENLWIGYEERGIDKFKSRESKLPLAFKNIKTKHGLVIGIVKDIQSLGGSLWVATTNGLCRFTIDKPSKVETKEPLFHLNRFTFAEKTFPANSVYCIAPFGNDKMAAGTELGLVVPDGDNWKLFGRPEGLPGDRVTSMCSDGTRLWLGNSAGIFAFEGGKFTQVVGEGTQGFPTRFATCMTAQKMPNGETRIYIGTVKGARIIIVK